MLAFSPSRTASLSRFVIPAAFFAVGALASVAGCAEEGGGSASTASPATMPARFPVGHASRERRDRGAWGARTLLAGANEGPRLLPLGESGHSPLAPFENLLDARDRPLEPNGLCPPDMASINDRYCVDRYEASLVEVLSNGDERPWSPYAAVDGRNVRAVSEANVIPQGYISEIQAQEACVHSGKRLCKPAEWRKACMGPEPTTYGYGRDNEPGRCNDSGRSPVVATYGQARDLGDRGQWNWDHMNDPSLNQLDGTLAPTGSHDGCTNGYGVYDMVGNLHEWVADPQGTFQGGYYQDTHLNGDGCTYKTMAHAAWYHDYSTGFRCCADVAP
jgi:sulfatase modifying factor 1